MDQEQSLDALHLLLQGMVEKDRAKLEQSMTRDARLYHISGLAESREDYIRDILDGTLNYYDYRIKEMQGDVVRASLLAKVYGGVARWWNLAMEVQYAEEDDFIKIKESKVKLDIR